MKLKHWTVLMAALAVGGCASTGGTTPDATADLEKSPWKVIVRLENHGQVVHEFSGKLKNDNSFQLDTDQFIRIQVGRKTHETITNAKLIDASMSANYYRLYPNGPVVTGRITKITEFSECPNGDLFSDIPKLKNLIHNENKTDSVHVCGKVEWSVMGNREFEAIRLNTRESFYDVQCPLGEWVQVEIGKAEESWQVMKIKFEKVGPKTKGFRVP